MRMPFCGIILFMLLALPAHADDLDDSLFRPLDVFELEYASDPQISPDGKQIVYVRNFMDIMKDRRRANLWIINSDGSEHRSLTTGNVNDTSPRWSPDGQRLVYVAGGNGESEIYLRWMDTGQTAKLTNLRSSPNHLVWSPDGRKIAFSMHLAAEPEPFVKMPKKPKGAEWAAPFQMTREVTYRFDGQGYLKQGFHHLFVLSAEGGTPRQLTSGAFHHRDAPAWSADGKSLIFSANRSANWQYESKRSELYQITLADRKITALTDRVGPDSSPAVSPDGQHIAYVGYDDRQQGHQISALYVMNRDGSKPRQITTTPDRSVQDPKWSDDGQVIFFRYDDQGNTKIGATTLDGKVRTLAKDVGGTTIGRPYASGSFSLSTEGTFAYTYCRPEHPADVAVGRREESTTHRVTALNQDLLDHKQLATTEEIWYKSSFDGRKIHGWVVKPPGFDPKLKYPLILEIHGGPFANYGDRFSAEIQLFAAAGYVVLYTNPRGSTGYGEKFGNLIHHAYPGNDYDDLMSGVDAVIKQGSIDPARLFVTGGSGGGILTSWVVGKTDRFRAAVAAKPVINWYSFVLTTDAYPFFTKYWFPGFPWDHSEHYLKRSPLSLVGNVKTPTMLLTGEEDHRTPISESEQFYQALKLRKIDTALVRVPGASHGIASRPSNLIAKVAHILQWFEIYGEGK